jgi:cytidylate kinase
MPNSSRNSSGGVTSILERQMRNWEMMREKGGKIKSKEPCCREVQFYVTISRECGCGAEDIADALAERTGFQKFDKEILDFMVTRDDVRRRLYETLDDHTLGWIEDVLSSISFGPAVNEIEYFNRLSHAVLAVCHNTHAIVIGRGAHFILPRQCGLAVRLVAPMNYRLDNYAKRMGVDLRVAREQMETIDHHRSQFIENHFGKYAYDPRRYDVVINVSQFPKDGVIDLIVAAMEAKLGKRLELPVQTVGQGEEVRS